jgi:pilus assembly protein CpaD
MSSFTKRTTLLASAAVLSSFLMGCEHIEDKSGHHAGWTLLEPAQRHPIVVSQQQQNLSLRVARGAQGLNPHQRAQLADFLSKYRSAAGGNNSRVVVSVPSGSANEVSAMHAVSDVRLVMAHTGVQDQNVSVEPYHSESDPQPPIRVSFVRFVAEGPECGRWPDNLGTDSRNHAYHNYGCAYQRNMAAMIANPADLITPRTMTPAESERRGVMLDKYKKGEATGTGRSEESASVKGN